MATSAIRLDACGDFIYFKAMYYDTSLRARLFCTVIIRAPAIISLHVHFSSKKEELMFLMSLLGHGVMNFSVLKVEIVPLMTFILARSFCS